MKTAELTGSELAQWVARALGYKVEREGDEPDDWFVVWFPNGDVSSFGEYGWRPDLNWAHGGPIIEKKRIAVIPFGLQWSAGFNPRSDCHMANDGDGHFDDMSSIVMDHEQYGDTSLQAAMRAFVASKYGEEVPDEETL